MPEIIGRGMTADEKRVFVWDDGSITDGAGRGWTRSRLPLTWAFCVASEACLFDSGEMPSLVRAAAKLARRGNMLPGVLRAMAARNAAKKGIVAREF